MLEQNEKRTFYVISRLCYSTGIGAIMGGYSSHILYARDNGYIPVVDMKHLNNQYFKDGRIGKDNTWEYFFDQPDGYTLDDIDESNDEIIISRNSLHSPDKSLGIFVTDLPVKGGQFKNDRLIELKKRHQSVYLFNKQTREYMENEYNRVIGDKKGILGVLCRGSDYYIKKPSGEPRQPNPVEVISKVREFMKKYPEITKIYIATEDKLIYQMFKEEFGDKLLDNNQYRYEYTGKDANKFLSNIKVDRPNHSYQLGLEYLSSLYILSKCDYFIGGRCAGTRDAFVMQDCWKDAYIWNLGVYDETSFWQRNFEIYYSYNKIPPRLIVRFFNYELKTKKIGIYKWYCDTFL